MDIEVQLKKGERKKEFFYLGFYIDKENNVYKQGNPITATVPILVSNDKYYTMVDTTAYQSNIAASANLPTVSTASGLYTYIKAKS